jgi:iron complex outermembrane recepter protein
MKKRQILLLFLLLSTTAVLKSQAQSKISGEVAGMQQKPLEGAVVLLINAKNEAIIKSVFTDTLGKYTFTTALPDSFLINIGAFGYKKFNSAVLYVNREQQERTIEKIQLQQAASTLETAEVIGKLPFVQKKIDRTVINPDALISNAGTNALEVLEKAPGILVDANGAISLKGKQGVLIFIDDKPSYLSSADLTNYLKSLPASSLATIEIMTNPPAKYDAAGNAGVINIKIKRTKTKGFNGGINTSYGQGTYARSNNSINFNYRVNKINFFTNIGYSINNSYQDLFIKRKYYKPSGALNTAFNQNSYIKKQNTGANIKLGADYYINKKSTIGIALTGFRNINKTTTTNTAQLYDSANALQNNISAFNPSKRNFKNGSINLNYQYKIDTKGSEIAVNADYIDYNSLMDQSLLNIIYLSNGNFSSKTNLLSNLPATINIKTIKADYSTPLKNNAKFEAGAKTSFVNTDNVANFFDEANNIITTNNDFSNNFRYKENINAAYINYSLEGKRFSVQTGLRVENTQIKGNQLGNAVRKDSSFSRNYTNAFPTVYLSYNVDSLGKHQLGFSYGKRINRPDYQSLNPFTYPLDRFTLYGGNPFLKPTFSHNFELSHTYNNKITTAFGYSFTQDEISETIEQGTNIFYSRPGNVGKRISYGVSVNADLSPYKWWKVQLYTEVTYNSFTGNLYNQQLENKGTFWVLAPVNMFTINKKWNAELSGTYQTSIYNGQFVTIPVFTMRGGVSRKILKDKGTLKLNINDMFYTQQPGGDIKAIANSNASWLSYLDTRVVSISFGYRFNKGKSLAARQSGASDTEKSRVK